MKDVSNHLVMLPCKHVSYPLYSYQSPSPPSYPSSSSFSLASQITSLKNPSQYSRSIKICKNFSNDFILVTPLSAYDRNPRARPSIVIVEDHFRTPQTISSQDSMLPL